MLSDSELKSRFVAALEEVTPAAPWLSHAVKRSLAGVDRHRSKRRPPIRIGTRLAAVIALVVLVAALVAGLLLQHFPVPPPIPASPHVPVGMQWREGGMIDRDVGWTLVYNTWGDGYSDRVLRTTDGGRSWRLITPPGVTSSVEVKAGSFIDADHASVTVVGGFGDTSQLYTFRTVDGGATWQVGNPTPAASIGFEISTSFLDSLNGWLLYTDRLKGGLLYRTTDGGMHWRLLANRPADDTSFTDPPGVYCYTWCRVQFVSLKRGWIRMDHPTAHQSGLFVTDDGGATWKPQPLPLALVNLSCPCEQDLPQFADDAHGFTIRGASSVTQYSPRDPQDHLALFATDDGGASWSARPLPGAGQMRIGFRDAQHGWVIAASASALQEPVGRSDAPNLPLPLYVTSDGGRTWTRVATTQPLQSSAGALTDLYFVDAKTAFAWAFRVECVRTPDNPKTCVDPGMPPDTNTLLRSDDGGRTWKAIWVTKF
jgi:photosystem II stability/assembly factor-like uncharacterized protein